MAKKSSAKTADEKDRRSLVKAQMGLQIAQDKRRLAITKGEDEIERARQRAARRVDKATKRVEKYAALVVETERRRTATGATISPETASNYLASIDGPPEPEHTEEPIVLAGADDSAGELRSLSIDDSSAPS